MRVELIEPKLEEMDFRQRLLADEATMSYNHAWGGTIDWPRHKWEDWYDYWVIHHEGKRFYRYLLDEGLGEYVGETAYHFDEERKIHVADIIILAEYRGKGYGNIGLNLLCDAAREKGVDVLYDDIAIDNPGIVLFIKNGFTEDYRTKEIIMLKKVLYFDELKMEQVS